VRPVPSLDPQGTERLWRAVVRARQSAPTAAAGDDCRPLRTVFYAATDWIRLATVLASKASPCAQYYVTVPPLSSDKTVFRPGQAAKIRALGPGFHAMAEVHMATWRVWVGSTGSTWYQAGVEARKRMATAGYDVALGDSWAVNELSSAVRKNTGAARQEARDFVHGLYEGDGTLPTARGAVFVIGVPQTGTDVVAYQARMEDWLEDAPFWADMSAYVSDWSDELYGDVRRYAVAGSTASQRRDALNEYLQHQIALSFAGPDGVATARAFLGAAYSPLANAAWQWTSAFGWTDVSVDLMKSFVSAQTYALRSYSASILKAPTDHWGFAWSPVNADGLSNGDFTRQTADILDRLATAIRDSGQTLDPTDPGSGACGTPGQHLYCIGDLDGARFTAVWRSFSVWTLPGVMFTSAPQTLIADATSKPITLQLQQAGIARPTTTDVALTLSSSSSQGSFATTPDGPWTPTLTLLLPAGTSTAPSFYYRDTKAGAPTLAAQAPGSQGGSQVETVRPGPLAGITLSPTSVTATVGATLTLTAAGADAFGNAVSVANAAWSVTPATLGTFAPTVGSSVAFAPEKTGSGTIAATVATAAGSVSTTAPVTVAPPPLLRVASVRYAAVRRQLRVSVKLVDAAGKPIPRGKIAVTLLRNGGHYRSTSATTGTAGRAIFKTTASVGCYRTTITRLQAPGFRWSGRTPTNRFCKTKAA